MKEEEEYDDEKWEEIIKWKQNTLNKCENHEPSKSFIIFLSI